MLPFCWRSFLNVGFIHVQIATCVDFAKEGGSAFFHIIGIIVFCDFATTYCGDSKAVFADAKSSVKVIIGVST